MVRYYNELTRLEMEQVDKDETVVMIPVGALETSVRWEPTRSLRRELRDGSKRHSIGRSRIIRC